MTASDPTQYAKPTPHDPLEEIFPDVFLLRGSMRMNPLMQISRNMVVLRENGALTLIDPVRLSPEGERRLQALGEIKHVMRLGYYHGLDDAYYVDTFNAAFWCQPGSEHYSNPRPTQPLGEDGPLPISNAELFVFHHAQKPECALLIHAHGGLLIACDSIQHYADWRYCSWLARLVMKRFGFSLTTLVGPLWLKIMTPKGGSLKADFDRLLRLNFSHLIGAHGSLNRDHAHEAVRMAVQHAFSESR
jgi:hypothetical protein